MTFRELLRPPLGFALTGVLVAVGMSFALAAVGEGTLRAFGYLFLYFALPACVCALLLFLLMWWKRDEVFSEPVKTEPSARWMGIVAGAFGLSTTVFLVRKNYEASTGETLAVAVILLATVCACIVCFNLLAKWSAGPKRTDQEP